MDPFSVRALSALEPFVALSKSATSPAAAADLVTRATSHPQAYVFAELLDTPNIQALKNAPDDKHKNHFTLLEIFCWGTWSDYEKTPNLPSLNPNQTTKLRLLTLLTLCATHPTSSLPYSYLQRSLSLPSNSSSPAIPKPAESCSSLVSQPTLDSVVTTAITLGLITAKLSPKTSTLIVSSVAPLRDLPPNSIPALDAILADWEARCGDVVTEIESHIAKIRAEAEERVNRRWDQEIRVESALNLDPAKENSNNSVEGGGAEAKEGGGGSVGAGAAVGTAAWATVGSGKGLGGGGGGPGQKKRDYVSLDGGDDEDEGFEDVDEVAELTGAGFSTGGTGGMDLDNDPDEAPATGTGTGTGTGKGKGKGIAGGGRVLKQRALGLGKRGRDS